MSPLIHSVFHRRQIPVAIPVAFPGAFPVAVQTATPSDAKNSCTLALFALRCCFRQGQGKP